MDLIQTWCYDRYNNISTLHFDTSLFLTLTLIQGHMSVRKQKLLRLLSHKIFN